MAALTLILIVYCLGTRRDLLAIYWGAVAIFALRFALLLPEPD
jgi:hypothetical protein